MTRNKHPHPPPRQRPSRWRTLVAWLALALAAPLAGATAAAPGVPPDVAAALAAAPTKNKSTADHSK
ncbi:MAG: hypothetical protein U1D36_23500, partial [Hydrogenophaga sp.]|nr:hypothetical protein [Hydrogenophaga sp.]